MSQMPWPEPRAVGWLLLTMLIAAAGGGLFTWLGLPAAWLTGSMLATVAAAFAGLPVGLPVRLRDTAFLLLGISMGASATPESIAQMQAWPGSLALLALSVAATMLAAAVYLEQVHGWDRVTARCASIPGAFSAVVVIASGSEADLPRVVLAQSIRIFTLVALMPAILALTSPTTGAVITTATSVTNSLPEVLVTLAASGILAAAMARLRVPAAPLLGAMVASALLHATGMVHGRFPPTLVIVGFVATGIVIGGRFRGTSLITLRRTIPGAVASVLLALAISAAIAGLGTALLGLPFGQLWLAYAPGGVEAMAAMALALNLDPAFVGAHHILRILGLNLISPVWLRMTR
jgi:membrane AbrB-like protein